MAKGVMYVSGSGLLRVIVRGRSPARMRPDDVRRLHDLPLAPEARGARQPLLSREHTRAPWKHGRSPPPRPCADPLRGVRLPLPLPEPVQGERRLPRHAALLDLPDPSASDLRVGRAPLTA